MYTAVPAVVPSMAAKRAVHCCAARRLLSPQEEALMRCKTSSSEPAFYSCIADGHAGGQGNGGAAGGDTL